MSEGFEQSDGKNLAQKVYVIFIPSYVRSAVVNRIFDQ